MLREDVLHFLADVYIAGSYLVNCIEHFFGFGHFIGVPVVFQIIEAPVGPLFGIILGKVMGGLVTGTSATDPLTLGGSGLVLLVVALTACAVPAWRASRVDPLKTLGAE